MTLQDSIFNLVLTNDGKAIEPSVVRDTYTANLVQDASKITVVASASDATINVADRGTYDLMVVGTDEGTTELSLKVNGGSAGSGYDITLKRMVIFTDDVTTLTVSNSDSDNAKNLYIMTVSS